MIVLALEDIPDGGSAGADRDPSTGAFRIMLIRRSGRVWAYRNACPHRGLPLDPDNGRFLAPDGKSILCVNHVALFRIEDGACLDGPCGGKGLEPVPVTVNGGTVEIGVEPQTSMPRRAGESPKRLKR